MEGKFLTEKYYVILCIHLRDVGYHNCSLGVAVLVIFSRIMRDP